LNHIRTDSAASCAARDPHLGKYDIVSGFAIALLPFILLFINNNWIFDAMGWIDPWIYAGFHLHLPQFLVIFGDTYYASRVPWTIAGWILHLAFSDAVANYVLHFVVFYLTALSLYFAIRTIFVNCTAAYAAAILLGTSSYFLAAVGWNYVDGPSIACSLGGIAALASAATGRRWRSAAFLWGVASCAMVSMYISLVLLVPIQIAMFLLLNRLRNRRSVPMVAILFASGGVGAVLFFGFVNWLLGGPFLYFMGQVNVAITHGQPEYNHPLGTWIWSSPWLFAPAIAFIFSCGYLFLHAKSSLKRIWSGNAGSDLEGALFVCCLGNVAASFVYIFFQANHFPVLEYAYEVSPLLSFTYLSVGAALAATLKHSKWDFWLNFVAAALITIAPWWLASAGHIFPRREWFSGPTHVICWIVAGSLILLFSTYRSYYSLGRAALAVLFLSTINLGAPASQLAYPPNDARKSQVLDVFEASRAIGPYYPVDGAQFWFNAASREAGLFKSIASTYLFEYSLLNQNFPKLITTDGQSNTLLPGDRIFLLTSNIKDPLILANNAIADHHLFFKEVTKIAVDRPGAAFSILVTDVKLEPGHYEEIPSSQAFAAKLPSKIDKSAAPWFRFSVVPFSDQVMKQAGPGYVKIRLRVDKGILATGILKKGHKGWVTLRHMKASSRLHDVFLRVPDFSRVGPLVFLNAEEPAAALVKEVSIIRPIAKPRFGAD
jgi:hypothetical protein